VETPQTQAVRAASENDPWRLSEEVRRKRLREDGSRPLAVNLAEGLALTEYLSRFTGSAQKS
jgi:hypothetical protein